MYGHLLLREDMPGRKPRLRMIQVREISLLRAEVPVRADMRPGAVSRRVRRAAERLWEEGVNRVLLSSEFPHGLWPILERCGLDEVETAPLCRSMAAPLVLATLKKRGIDPAGATVCLRATRAMPELEHNAVELIRQVGQLIIDVPGWGGLLADWLHREFGVPLVEPGAVLPHLTTAFSEDAPGDLCLWGRHPQLEGLSLDPVNWDIPEEFVPLSFLAVLWECGQLQPQELRVVPA